MTVQAVKTDSMRILRSRCNLCVWRRDRAAKAHGSCVQI